MLFYILRSRIFNEPVFCEAVARKMQSMHHLLVCRVEIDFSRVKVRMEFLKAGSEKSTVDFGNYRQRYFTTGKRCSVQRFE